MLYDMEGNPTEKYHLIFCNPDKEVLGRLSFNYARDQQFFMLDQVGEIVYQVLKTMGLLEKHPNYSACWTRDIQVHELTYYKSITKTECSDSRCEGCSHCEDYGDEIYTIYFFTDEYMSDWYFKEHFGFLIENSNLK